MRYAVDGYGVLSWVIGGMIDRMRMAVVIISGFAPGLVYPILSSPQPQLFLYFPGMLKSANLAHGNITSDFHVFLRLVDEVNSIRLPGCRRRC